MPKENSKSDILTRIKYELDRKSSVVLGIKPDIAYKPDEKDKNAHCYAIINCHVEKKAI